MEYCGQEKKSEQAKKSGRKINKTERSLLTRVNEMEKRDKKERLWPSYFGFGLFLL